MSENKKKMQAIMKELGPCSEVVKKTMMECFFVMEAGVREALNEDGLNVEVNRYIGGQAGSCYEKGLNKLALCLD